ncbi:DNA (cytosine-5-)-methyltransferase [Gottfriedia acidiceleris]|uniref:DNA (cytosine-5-)-methyltransferase n=1 Tax=Gottfriedia acidiceleris TaxID=371036 RepID=A0ABY4JRA6_9BACI|nr:DNA (cytosine-5-)-methyltransferase [Gottfriedia acidiceleris]UPM56368.1 DNA (cytosine-5-)-methyltransferase [Gottfriedia acidiceleris]
MYRVVSLFAGIGGICLGFNSTILNGEQAAKVIWANEIDSHSCLTYQLNFGNNNLWQGDINEINEKIPFVDILTGGVPSEVFNSEGNHNGYDRTRKTLFGEFFRFIRDHKPRAVLLENVKDLLNHDNGNTLRIIKESLYEEGYIIAQHIFNSSEYGNVPQKRERIYLVGFLDLRVFDEYMRNPILPIELTRTIQDIIEPEERKDESFYFTSKSQYFDLLRKNVINSNELYNLPSIYMRENLNNSCPKLIEKMIAGGHNVPIVLDQHGIRKITPREALSLQGFPEAFLFPKGLALSHLYSQARNSATVPVVQRIAQNMVNALYYYDRINQSVSEYAHTE